MVRQEMGEDDSQKMRTLPPPAPCGLSKRTSITSPSSQRKDMRTVFCHSTSFVHGPLPVLGSVHTMPEQHRDPQFIRCVGNFSEKQLLALKDSEDGILSPLTIKGLHFLVLPCTQCSARMVTDCNSTVTRKTCTSSHRAKMRFGCVLRSSAVCLWKTGPCRNLQQPQT